MSNTADVQTIGSPGSDPVKFDLDEAVALLERTPAALRALLHGLPEPWTTCDEGPDTFSPWEVLGHLVHGERKDWIARASIILAQGDERTFEPFDRFAHRQESRGRTLDELLDEFEQLRKRNLIQLRGWNPRAAELRLEGVHPVFGTVTLEQLLATWVVHDLTHLTQIARVMAKRYAHAVGPWKEYLSVLNR